jgi:hypothetical protein
MAVKKNWVMDKKYIKEWNGYQVNMMRVAKDVCLKVDWNVIVDDVASLNKVSHSPARKTYNRLNPNEVAQRLWDETDYMARMNKLSGSKGIINLSGKGMGGFAYFSGGISVGMGGGLVSTLETLIHEITHIIHFKSFEAPTINGKRRPHDWVFNAIMLRAMEKYFGLNKSQLEPRCMGWSVGNGYAPSRSIERIFNEKFKTIEDIPKRLSKHFNKDIPEVKVKKVLTDEENEMKIASGFRTTLTSAFKGCGEYDGWTQVMGDSWDLDSPYEYMDILKETVKKTMTLKGLDDIQIEVLSWLINDENEHWMEMREMSWSAQEKKQDRLEELWRYLNRGN